MPQARGSQDELSGEEQGDKFLYWREASGGPFPSTLPMDRYQPVGLSARLPCDDYYERSPEHTLRKRENICRGSFHSQSLQGREGLGSKGEPAV